MGKYLLLMMFSLPLSPAMAQPDSFTPQYSGPSAVIENRGMARDGRLPSFAREPRGSVNDRAADWESQQRSKRAQSEMIRRQQETTRANQRHTQRTHKTNE